MISGAQQTLFLPFDNGILSMPEAGERYLACGIAADKTLGSVWAEALTCLQPFRPDWLKLQSDGFQAVSRLSDEGDFAGGLLLLGKHRGRNEAWFAELLSRVKPGGRIVVSGDKKLGIDSFRKWVGAVAEVEDRMAKNHGVAFWLKRPADLSAAQIEALKPQSNLIDGIFRTQPGMFSHNGIDKGSSLLVPHMKNIVFGNVADFGAGWGYLAAQCLQEAKKITKIDLYEADYESIEAARDNLKDAAVPLTFNWCDVTREPIKEIYDTVVMNPPFHEGRSPDASLGQAFITVAAQRLKIGGRLLLVANRQLPYETVLKSLFRTVNPLTDTGGFKVLEARK